MAKNGTIERDIPVGPSIAVRYYRETRVAQARLLRVPVIHFSRCNVCHSCQCR